MSINGSTILLTFFRLFDSKSQIFFNCFQYHRYYEAMFLNLLKQMISIIILKIMKHDRAFFSYNTISVTI